MNICRYTRAEIEPPYVYWDTACGRGIVCQAELPTDHGRLFCPFCGKSVKLGYAPLKVNTYDGWLAQGFAVMKGERSGSRNESGVCLFTEEQVMKKLPKSHPSSGWRDDPFPDDDIPF